MAKVAVHTGEYEGAYGRRPRGRGTWAFIPVRGGKADYDNPIMRYGMYSQVRDRVAKEVAETMPEVTSLRVGS